MYGQLYSQLLCLIMEKAIPKLNPIYAVYIWTHTTCTGTMGMNLKGKINHYSEKIFTNQPLSPSCSISPIPSFPITTRTTQSRKSQNSTNRNIQHSIEKLEQSIHTTRQSEGKGRRKTNPMIQVSKKAKERPSVDLAL